MASFKLNYTAQDINTRLGKVSTLESDVTELNNTTQKLENKDIELENKIKNINEDTLPLIGSNISDLSNRITNLENNPAIQDIDIDWNEEDENSNNYIANKPPVANGNGNKSMVIGLGEANGDYSIAGGTNDKSLITNIIGDAAALLVPTPDKAKANGDVSMSFGAGTVSHTAGSMALGINSTAGILGYYMWSINTKTNKITLSLNQPGSSSRKIPSKLEWKTGDVLSIVNDSAYPQCCTITAIDTTNKIITVDTLPFYFLETGSLLNPLLPEDLSVIVADKPNSGEVAFGYASYAHGYNCKATGSLSTAIGYQNTAIHTASFVTGRENTGVFGSLVGGYKNTVTGASSSATGRENVVSGSYSTACGCENKISADYSSAEGKSNTVTESFSHAEGYHNTAKGHYSHVEGRECTAFDYSHAEGRETTASSGSYGYAAHSEGYQTNAAGDGAHAEGVASTASNSGAHAEGGFTTASGEYSHAEGLRAVAVGLRSHAEGTHSYASGLASHAEGYETSATSEAAHSEGRKTTASGEASHAEGHGTTASGESSHAEGLNTTASGIRSHAEGTGTTASGDYSHSEGGNTKAEGTYSHAEGNGTKSIGISAHAEGDGTTASGDNSHAEGYYSIAIKPNAHAEGCGTQAFSAHQHVQGKYNIPDENNQYAHIVGNGINGSSPRRSNAHTLDWKGNAWYAGTIEATNITPRKTITNLIKRENITSNGLYGSTGGWDTNASYSTVKIDCKAGDKLYIYCNGEAYGGLSKIFCDSSDTHDSIIAGSTPNKVNVGYVTGNNTAGNVIVVPDDDIVMGPDDDPDNFERFKIKCMYLTIKNKWLGNVAVYKGEEAFPFAISIGSTIPLKDHLTHWYGKSWYAYGTSLTEDLDKGKYTKYLKDLSGMNLTNKGIGSQGITNIEGSTAFEGNSGEVKNAIMTLDDGKANADLITLEVGANDVVTGEHIGNFWDTEDTTFCGCLNQCIQYLQENTNAQILIIPSSYSKTGNKNGANITKAIEECCRYNCVAYVEPEHNMGIRKVNAKSKYLVDNIHHSELGGYIYASSIWAKLKTMPLFY